MTPLNCVIWNVPKTCCLTFIDVDYLKKKQLSTHTAYIIVYYKSSNISFKNVSLFTLDS